MSPAPKAVLIDALGTLVELQPPAPRLREALGREGFEVSEEQAAAGIGAEIAYYLAHHLEGRDRESLDDLRDRCAEEMRNALGVPGLGHAEARRAMMEALVFEPYPDAVPGLWALRERGLRLVIASNWDCSLPDWLGPPGLLELVDGVVTSADVRAPKPAPEVFLRALEVAGARPDEALHVGDSVANDVEGAAAAGIRALLVLRAGEPPPGVEAVRSLEEVPSLI
jgi:putative hydrolase of the HAD superfamily